MAHYRNSEWAGPISETQLTPQAATVTGMEIISADYRTHRLAGHRRHLPEAIKAEDSQLLPTKQRADKPLLAAWPQGSRPNPTLTSERAVQPPKNWVPAQVLMQQRNKDINQVRSRKQDEFRPLTSTNSKPLSKIPTKHHEKAYKISKCKDFLHIRHNYGWLLMPLYINRLCYELAKDVSHVTWSLRS